MGRGVFVGSGVGVGTLTSSLPTEHPRLPANIITSNRLDSDLRLINKLSIPLPVVNRLLSPSDNSCPDTLRRRGENPKHVKASGPISRVTTGLSYLLLNRIKSQTHWLGSVLYDSVTTGET